MAVAWIIDEQTRRTTRHFIHRGHALQALLEVEQKLREVVELVRDPMRSLTPFLDTAQRLAGPDEPTPALGRPGPGSRLMAAIDEAVQVARAARDPSALNDLPADSAPERTGKARTFGEPGELHHPAVRKVLGDLDGVACGRHQAGRRQRKSQARALGSFGTLRHGSWAFMAPHDLRRVRSGEILGSGATADT